METIKRDLPTVKLRQIDIREANKVLRAAGYGGYLKRVAERVTVEGPYENYVSFNNLLTGHDEGIDDLADHCNELKHLQGVEIDYDPMTSVIRFDLWLYEMPDDYLMDHCELWGIVIDGKIAKWSTNKLDSGDVMRAAVEYHAKRNGVAS